MTIKDLPAGKSATILKVGGDGALRQHFLDMGLIQGAEVTVIKYAPMGDPVELRIHSYELTIRLSDAEQIEVSEPYCIDNKAVENVTQKNTKFHNRILITEHKIFLFFEVRGPVKDRRNIPKTVNQ